MRYRIALLAIVCLVYGALFSLRALGLEDLYENILYGWGVIPFQFPFVDAHNPLAAAQCYHAGIDPFPTNPCDVLLRPMPYSPLWLDLIPPSLTTADTPVLGVAIIGIFLVGVLLVLRPSSWRDVLVMAVACASSCVAFAIERGNADLLIFGLAAFAAALLGLGRWARLGSYTLGFVGGLLKYYPFLLLGMALTERPKRFVAIAAAAGAGLLAFGAYYSHGIWASLAVVPSGAYFGDAFNAQNLPFGIGELSGYGDGLAYGLMPVLIAACLGAALALSRALGTASVRLDLDQVEACALLAGSLVVVGCFFAGQNVGYRAIFLLLVLPGLIQLRHSISESRLRTVLSLALYAVLLLMWEEGIRHTLGLNMTETERTLSGAPRIVFWAARELVWWSLVSVLSAVLVLFTVQSPLGRDAVRLWRVHTSRSGW